MKRILKVILSSLPLVGLLACENSKPSSTSILESSSNEESIITESKSSEFDSSISESITSSEEIPSSSIEVIVSSTSSSEPIVKTFTVTWTNYDGTVLKTDTDVLEGSTPFFTGEDPTRENDDTYSYSFTGWTPNIEPVSKDITYTATYSSEPIQKYYKVTFQNYDETQLYEIDVLEGCEAIYVGEIPTKPEDEHFLYEFDGWDKELSNITNDLLVTAMFKNIAKNWGPIHWFD